MYQLFSIQLNCLYTSQHTYNLIRLFVSFCLSIYIIMKSITIVKFKGGSLLLNSDVMTKDNDLTIGKKCIHFPVHFIYLCPFSCLIIPQIFIKH